LTNVEGSVESAHLETPHRGNQGKQEAFLFFWFSENQIVKEDDGIGSVKVSNCRETLEL
jgi:hypothetical protein